MVLTETEEKKRLQQHAMNQPRVSQAPVTFIVLADRDGWKDGHPFVERNFKEMVEAGTAKEGSTRWYQNARKNLYGQNMETELAFACKNAAFFAMTLMITAQGLGLNTHPMDGFDQTGVKKEFNIPENYWIPVLIAMGYFDDTQKATPPKWRKSYNDIVVTF